MKILIFTSNVGSYLQIFPLLEKYKYIFSEITFLLSGNCLELNPDLENITIIKKDQFTKQDINNFINQKKFDSAYVGMTGLFNTCENYLCLLCKREKIVTWTIQDYPQYYGTFAKDNHPEFILVLDHKSLKDSLKEFPNAKSIHVFSPKHTFFNLDKDIIKEIEIKLNSLDQPYISIAYQPFAPGVKYNLDKFIKYLELSKLQYEICLHPDQFSDFKLIDELSELRYLSSINKTINKNIVSFFSALNVVTCFSTVAIDIDNGLGKLNANCKKIHYLFEGINIKNTFRGTASNLKQPFKTKNIPSAIYSNVKVCVDTLCRSSSDLNIKDYRFKLPNKTNSKDEEIDSQFLKFFSLLG